MFNTILHISFSHPITPRMFSHWKHGFNPPHIQLSKTYISISSIILDDIQTSSLSQPLICNKYFYLVYSSKKKKKMNILASTKFQTCLPVSTHEHVDVNDLVLQTSMYCEISMLWQKAFNNILSILSFISFHKSFMLSQYVPVFLFL